MLAGFLPENLPADLPAGALRRVRERPCYAMDLGRLRAAGEDPEAALPANTQQQIRRSLRLFGGREGRQRGLARTIPETEQFLDALAELRQHVFVWGALRRSRLHLLLERAAQFAARAVRRLHR